MYSIPQLYNDFIRGHRVTTDSRSIQEGDVFIALKGENFNGNQFARQLWKRELLQLLWMIKHTFFLKNAYSFPMVWVFCRK